MLKKIHTRARPRIFKPTMAKSRWKSNICVVFAVFLLLLSVSLLHSRLGAEGNDSKKNVKSVHVSKFPVSRKQLISRGTDGKDRVLDGSEQLGARTGGEDGSGLSKGGNDENWEIDQKEVSDDPEEDDDNGGDEDAGNNEMEDFDGFDEEDRIDELDEGDDVVDDDDGGIREKGGSKAGDSEKSLSANEKKIEVEGEENGSGDKTHKGSKDDSMFSKDLKEVSKQVEEEKRNSGKRLERLANIRIDRQLNYSDEQKRMRNSLDATVMQEMPRQLSHKDKAGLFWDHVMGVTRKAFMKHRERRPKWTDPGNGKTEEGLDIQADGGWKDEIIDDSLNDDRGKEAFSSDDEPVDEGIRNRLEEVAAIEDALLLKSSDRSSPLRSGWAPWFDNVQRRASKGDFIKRDRMARSTLDLLNPMNNPLLQDPDAIGVAGLTKSDKAIQKALKKATIEGIPFVGDPSSPLKEVADKNLEEETDIVEKKEIQNAVALGKTLEDSNLDGGEEASLKELNNADNDDDASLKTGLTQLTRKALDKSDSNRTYFLSNVDERNSRSLTETLRGNGRVKSMSLAEVVERNGLLDKGLNKDIKSLGNNIERRKLDAQKSNSRRKKMLLKKQGGGSEEDTARKLHSVSASKLHESKHRDSLGFQSSSSVGTRSAEIYSLKTPNRIAENIIDSFPSDNIVNSTNSADEDMVKMSNSKNIDAEYVLIHEGNKTTGITDTEEIQRRGDRNHKNSVSHKKVQRKIHDNEDTRRWGYFPALDPLLSFSEFMDEFLENGNCSLRVFMAWTTPPWSYTVRHQRGLESLLYFHPRACVVVFSDSIELDFFNDFVKDGYRVAVVMPNLDELLFDTPTHIFASVWLDWRKVDLYYIHYTELLRLAALYKYGGVYLDSDVIVLKPLDSLNNSLGTESPVDEELSLNGAVMAFEKNSSFILDCLTEFTATYDDTLLRWNGAELLTRVAKESIKRSGKNWVNKTFKIQPHWAFFPLSFHNIKSYFTAPENQYDTEMQEVLFKRILNESFTLHFWNNVTSKIVPETGSLVEKVLNYHCLHCTDFL